MIRDIVKWVSVFFTVVLVVVAIGLGGWILLAPSDFADRYKDVDIVTVNTTIGTFLILSGLALAAIGYLYQVVFKEEVATTLGAAKDFTETIKALTDLLKQAGGLGIAVMVIGLILLTGTVLGAPSDSTSETDDNVPSAEAGE